MLTTSLLAAAIAAFGFAAYYMPASHPRPAKGRVAQDFTPMDPSMWVTNWPHEKPQVPLTAFQAHKVMQSHRECKRDECPRKDAAWMTLVDAGEIVPRMPLIGGFR